MADVYIRRGTTPRIVCVLPADFTGHTLHLALRDSKDNLIVVDNSQLSQPMTVEEAEDGSSVTYARFRLTQEQTLSLEPGDALMQVRDIEGDEAAATNIIEVEIADVLEGGVIEDAY